MPARNSADPIDEVRSTARALGDAAEAEIAELRAKVEALMDQRVTPAVADAAGYAEAMATDAVDAVRRNADSLLAEVRARPLTSLGLAAAAGFLLAHLLRR